MSYHEDRMRQRTENPRFFFLTPRLLRYRQHSGTDHSKGQPSIHLPTQEATAVKPGGMRTGVLRSLGEGGHASANSAEDIKGATVVKPWGSTSHPGSTEATETPLLGDMPGGDIGSNIEH